MNKFKVGQDVVLYFYEDTVINREIKILIPLKYFLPKGEYDVIQCYITCPESLYKDFIYKIEKITENHIFIKGVSGISFFVKKSNFKYIYSVKEVKEYYENLYFSYKKLQNKVGEIILLANDMHSIIKNAGFSSISYSPLVTAMDNMSGIFYKLGWEHSSDSC